MEKISTEKVIGGWILSPQFYRDIHPGKFVEAICPHGIGHHKGVHGCHFGDDKKSACCANAPEGIWDKVSED